MARSSYNYIHQSYRVRAIDGYADGDHWQGGEARHEGAECPFCKRPLLLLWDINCHDPRFAAEPRRVFGNLQRVPFYFCWTCVGCIEYRVTAPDRIHVFGSTGRDQGSDFPYCNYPLAFERRPLELTDEVPADVEELIAKWEPEDILGEKLTDEEKERLDEWFGHPIGLSVGLIHHQLGGLTRLAQGPLELPCPNPHCHPRRGWLMSLLGSEPPRMKFLASILNDPRGGLPMVEELDEKTREEWNFFVSVVYHICDRCLTICAMNMGT